MADVTDIYRARYIDEPLTGLVEEDPPEVWKVYSIEHAIVATSRYPAATVALLEILSDAQCALDRVPTEQIAETLQGFPPAEWHRFNEIQGAVAALGRNTVATTYLLGMLFDAQRAADAADGEPLDEDLKEEHCIF